MMNFKMILFKVRRFFKKSYGIPVTMNGLIYHEFDSMNDYCKEEFGYSPNHKTFYLCFTGSDTVRLPPVTYYLKDKKDAALFKLRFFKDEA